MAQYDVCAIRVRSTPVIRGLISKIKLKTRRVAVRDGDILESVLKEYLARLDSQTPDAKMGPEGPTSASTEAD